MTEDEFKIKEEPSKKKKFIEVAVEAITQDEMVKYQTARIDMFIGTLLRLKGLVSMEREFAPMVDVHMDDINSLEEALYDTIADFIGRKKNGVRKRKDNRSD